ncbi:hypothetical protein Tel_15865 [Candidatus Tenderia electrophaga]|jgi:hypothetical protein|uniref:DUF4136 domain-containing protein n=1 Tax=Candidatus Tenderia electrophaga TaxID=1748243 RepID=A0A0S2TH68_9GAMM|nr:hypothetical protein Tel_15865 [Candidatus Tenderia electrophaga]
MNKRLRLTLIVIPLFIAACASTEITGKWKDRTYTQSIDKMLVIGMSKDQTRRRIYEDTLVQKLEQKGVTAVSSATLFAADQELSQDVLEPVLERESFDAMLVTRLVDVEKDTRYVPGHVVSSPFYYPPPHDYYYNFYDYHLRTRPIVYSPAYLVDDTIVSLETNVYETRKDTLIWSLTSKSFNPNSANQIIEELSEIITEQLEKDGLI